MRLPDFLILGAAKSGSTSLERYLAVQPQIYMCPRHEPRFFAFDGQDGWLGNGPGDAATYGESIVELEDYVKLFEGAPTGSIIGERSSIYLSNERAPQRIRHHIPKVNMVAVLRHPAERAYSNFLANLQWRVETTTDFERALASEESRITDGWGEIYHYFRRGLYGQQLTRYFELFDRGQIRIYLYEDLKDDPMTVIRDACSFLGVTEVIEPDLLRHNPSLIPRSERLDRLLLGRSRAKAAIGKLFPRQIRDRITRRLIRANRHKPRMPSGIREALIEKYEEDIHLTEKLTDRDLSHWLA